jgi:hypothetical protein
LKSRTVIFPHIPKCAGTSLKAAFENSKLNVFFDYDHPPSVRIYYRNSCERRNREFQNLDFSAFDLVYGHFPMKRYSRDTYCKVCLLRHPLDRAISHYNYFKYNVPWENTIAFAKEPSLKEIKEDRLSFFDFLAKDKLNHFYALYLERELYGYDLVGFVDEMETFLPLLCDLLGIRLNNLPFERRTRSKDTVPQDELERARDFLCEDTAFYDAMKQIYSKQS